jgi:hypothetical protein
VLRLGVPPTLARTLRSTNAIESMIGICRNHARNVKRWRDGRMALRWCAAGLDEARGQSRRVNGYLHLVKLAAELERVTASSVVVGPPKIKPPRPFDQQRAVTKFHEHRDNLCSSPRIESPRFLG